MSFHREVACLREFACDSAIGSILAMLALNIKILDAPTIVSWAPTPSASSPRPSRARGRAVDLLPPGSHAPKLRNCRVAVHVVIRRKNGSNLDGEARGVGQNRAEPNRFELFWTKGLRVRDREAPGSIPGPRPSFEYEPDVATAIYLITPAV